MGPELDLGRYQIEAELGVGASAKVFRARDLRLRRKVAVKAFRAELFEDARLRQVLLREARIHAQMEHANIVRIYDLLELGDRDYLVLQLLEGESLAQLTERRGGVLSPQEAIFYTRQVLRGLAYAHAKGIVHQDLKPQNIQITPSREALIVDFGIAVLMEAQPERRGTVRGSPAYMPPEQAQGKYLDARSDLYAVGMTLYVVVAGHHPFEGVEDVEQMMRAQIQAPPPPPTRFRRDLPPGLDDVLLRVLAKDPRDRFRCAEDFSDALAAVLRDAQPEPPREEDQRWDPRAEIALPARAVFAGRAAELNLRTINLSAGGVALRMENPPPIGVTFLVEIEPRSGIDRRPVRGDAEVVAVAPDGEAFRVGARFTEIDDRARRRIREIVRDCLVLGRPALDGVDGGDQAV